MINTQELRRHNWVTIGDPKDLFKVFDADRVSEIGLDWVELFREGTDGYSNSFKVFDAIIVNPIPLTIEIVKAAGFKYETFVASYNGVQLVYEQQVFRFYRDKEWIDINYLHQLQNLYFTMTTQELKIESWNQMN